MRFVSIRDDQRGELRPPQDEADLLEIRSRPESARRMRFSERAVSSLSIDAWLRGDEYGRNAVLLSFVEGLPARTEPVSFLTSSAALRAERSRQHHPLRRIGPRRCQPRERQGMRTVHPRRCIRLKGRQPRRGLVRLGMPTGSVSLQHPPLGDEPLLNGVVAVQLKQPDQGAAVEVGKWQDQGYDRGKGAFAHRDHSSAWVWAQSFTWSTSAPVMS